MINSIKVIQKSIAGTLLLLFLCVTSAFANECIEGNCREGAGTYQYSSGRKYVGEWKNGKRHGKGTLYFSDGNKYKGEWKNNRMDGYGMKEYPDGSTYVGEWRNSIKHGQGTMTYTTGETDKYTGEWKDGIPNGQGALIFKIYVDKSKASKYIGEVKNGLMHGQGTLTIPDGSLFIGEWKNGKNHKARKIVCSNGLQYSLLDVQGVSPFVWEEWRKKNGYSQEQLAILLGIYIHKLDDWEKKIEKTPLSIQFMLKCLDSEKI